MPKDTLQGQYQEYRKAGVSRKDYVSYQARSAVTILGFMGVSLILLPGLIDGKSVFWGLVGTAIFVYGCAWTAKQLDNDPVEQQYRGPRRIK